MNTQTKTAPTQDNAQLAQGREIENRIRDTIYQATLFLDQEKWNDWLALCDEDFIYQIKAFSPEINYDSIYMHESRDELIKLMDMLPKHNTDESPLSRFTNVYTVDVAADGATATATSAFVVYRHIFDSAVDSHIEAGSTELYLVGKYHDEFRITNGQPRFVARTTRLETRRMDRGSHWPI